MQGQKKKKKKKKKVTFKNKSTSGFLEANIQFMNNIFFGDVSKKSRSVFLKLFSTACRLKTYLYLQVPSVWPLWKHSSMGGFIHIIDLHPLIGSRLSALV